MPLLDFYRGSEALSTCRYACAASVLYTESLPHPPNLTLLNLHVSGFYIIYDNFHGEVGTIYPKLITCVTVVNDN